MQSKSVLLSLSLGRATECHSTSPREWSEGQAGKLALQVDTQEGTPHQNLRSPVARTVAPALSLGLPGWGQHD